MSYQPKITVITVSFNSVKKIESTIQSVLNQTYPAIEYIIVDGGSTDGTVDIIKKYERQLSYWISEPDMGVYDAMNKGITIASGEYINFMNTGDSFYTEDTIQTIIAQTDNTDDIIYGDTNVIVNFGNFIRKAQPNPTITHYMRFCHQAVFTKSQYLKSLKFDLQFKICADRNFFYQLAKKGNIKYKYIPITVCNYEADAGISSSKHATKSYKEIRQIEGRNSIHEKIWTRFTLIILNIRLLIRNILPGSVVKVIRRHINKHKKI